MNHRHALASLVLLSAQLAACGAQPGGDAVDTATSPDELLVANAAVWSGHTVEVCWNIQSAQTDPARRDVVRRAVSAAWESVADVRFTGWANCPRTGTFGDRVSIDARPGRARSSIGNNGSNNWVGIDLNDPNLRAVAVHEFGHTLGFHHEQARADTPTSCTDNDGDLRANPAGSTAVGLWDDASIMNYCNSYWTFGQLSLTDITGAQRYYGLRGSYLGTRSFVADVAGDGRAEVISQVSDRLRVGTATGAAFAVGASSSFTFGGDFGTYFADVTGDGKADAIAVDSEGVRVAQANGGTFQWFGTMSGPFFGGRGTGFGDVTGDGIADGVAINDDGLHVETSDGNELTYRGVWSDGAFVGSRGTFLADVNGDHKIDAVAFDDAGVRVVTSNGAHFSVSGVGPQWIGPFYGTRGNAVADVTGDGRADAIAINDDGIYLAASTGSSFVYLGRVYATAFLGASGFAFGDVTGDGKADGVFFSPQGTYVMSSLGFGFNAPLRWADTSLVATPPTASPDTNCASACIAGCSPYISRASCAVDCHIQCG